MPKPDLRMEKSFAFPFAWRYVVWRYGMRRIALIGRYHIGDIKMIHTDRIFSFQELGSEDELARAMTEHTWPVCYSFFYGKLLYLSDGNSEDNPEYAAVTIDSTGGHHGVTGREVGRIKPRGLSPDKVHEFIQNMSQGRHTSEIPVQAQVEPKWHHSCKFCQMDED